MLGNRPVRDRVVHQLRWRHFDGLNIPIRLGGEVQCYPFSDELSSSFEEIFLKAEYAPALKHLSHVRSWIDLGAYGGFFSLWLSWALECPLQDLRVCLVEADPRRISWLERLAGLNWGHDHCTVLHGAVAATGEGRVHFRLDNYMGARIARGHSSDTEVVQVPVLDGGSLAELFGGGVDLVKADIEGAEMGLLAGYGSLLTRTRWLLVEWHEGQEYDSSEERTRARAGGLGFELVEVVQHRRLAGGVETGVLLFRNKARP